MGLRIAFLLTFAVTLSACKDDPKPIPDANSNIDASTIDAAPGPCEGGTKGYLAICTDTAECGSCTCEDFGHAKVCTKACQTNADCPAPSPGCSSSKICRPNQL